MASTILKPAMQILPKQFSRLSAECPMALLLKHVRMTRATFQEKPGARTTSGAVSVHQWEHACRCIPPSLTPATAQQQLNPIAAMVSLPGVTRMEGASLPEAAGQWRLKEADGPTNTTATRPTTHTNCSCLEF
jgi:hypothetical protein